MAERTIENRFNLLQTTFCKIPEYIFVKDRNLRYIAATDSFAVAMGRKHGQDLLGKTDREILTDQQAVDQFEALDLQILRTGEDVTDLREEFYSKDAEIMYRSTSKFLIRDENGEPAAILGKVLDITKEVIAEHRYNQEIQTLFDMSDSDCYSAVIDLNEWKMVDSRINPAYSENMPVMTDLDAVISSSLSCADKNMEEASKFYSHFSFDYFSEQYRKGKDYFTLKYFHRLWNGSSLWMKDTMTVRINPENSHLMVLFSMQSIDELKQKELALHRAAELDGLTGLLNRNYARGLIENILNGPNDAKIYSMFMVDVDHFKQVNDSYGHLAGDQVLVDVANALRECFRADDLVCRLGGDEFVAFMARDKEILTTPARAQRVVDRVQKILIKGTDVHVTVSVGICDYPKDGVTLDELYSSADKALYRAKERGRNQFSIYSPRFMD